MLRVLSLGLLLWPLPALAEPLPDLDPGQTVELSPGVYATAVDSVSTSIREQPGVHIWRKESDELSIRSLGNPFEIPHAHVHYGPEGLIAFARYYSSGTPQPKRWNGTQWVNLNGSANRWETLQINGSTLTKSPSHLLINGTTKAAGIGSQFYLSDSRLVTTQRQPEPTISVFQWRSPLGAPLAEYQLSDDAAAPYIFATYGDQILLGYSSWHLFRLTSSGLDEIAPPYTPWQPYFAIWYDERLLIGSWPNGAIHEYDGEKLVEFSHQIPLDRKSESRWEAQSAAIYLGDLYVGVWPDGTVWRFDGTSWSRVARLFTDDAPYGKWGQRVQALTVGNGALYASTSNLHAERGNEISASLRRQYGTVWEIRGCCQVGSILK